MQETLSTAIEAAHVELARHFDGAAEALGARANPREPARTRATSYRPSTASSPARVGTCPRSARLSFRQPRSISPTVKHGRMSMSSNAAVSNDRWPGPKVGSMAMPRPSPRRGTRCGPGYARNSSAPSGSRRPSSPRWHRTCPEPSAQTSPLSSTKLKKVRRPVPIPTFLIPEPSRTRPGSSGPARTVSGMR